MINFLKFLILLCLSFALKAEDKSFTLKYQEKVEIDKKDYISYFVNTTDLIVQETETKYLIQNYDLGGGRSGIVIFFKSDGTQDRVKVSPYVHTSSAGTLKGKTNISQLRLGYIYSEADGKDFSGKTLNYSFNYDDKKYLNLFYSENDLRLKNKYLYGNARYNNLLLEKKREKEARYLFLPVTTLFQDSLGARYFFSEELSANTLIAKRNYIDNEYNLRQYNFSYMGKNFQNNYYITQNQDNPDLTNYYANFNVLNQYNLLNLSMGYNPAARSFVYNIQDSLPLNYRFTENFVFTNIVFNRMQLMENYQNLNNDTFDKRETYSVLANFTYSMKNGSNIIYTPGFSEVFQENLLYSQNFSNQFRYSFAQFGLTYQNSIIYSENVFNEYINSRTNSLIFTHDLKNNFDYYLRANLSTSFTENTELLTEEEFESTIYQAGLNYRTVSHVVNLQGILGESRNQKTNSVRLGYNYTYDDDFNFISFLTYNNYNEPGASTSATLGLNKNFQQKTLRLSLTGTQQKYIESEVTQRSVMLQASKTFTFYNIQSLFKNITEDKKDVYLSFYEDANFNQKKDANEPFLSVDFELYSEKDYIKSKSSRGETKVKNLVSDKTFSLKVDDYDISQQDFVGLKDGNRNYMVGLTQGKVSSVFIQDYNNPGKVKKEVSNVGLIVKCPSIGYEKRSSTSMGYADVKYPSGVDCTVELDTEAVLVKKELSPGIQKLDKVEINFNLELTKELEVVFLIDKNNNKTKDEDENDFVGKTVKILGKNYKVDSNSMVILTDFHPRYLELSEIEYDKKNYSCTNNLIRIPEDSYPSFSRTMVIPCKKNSK